jgi:hypothetical protein
LPPKAALLDHVVGELLEVLRHRETKCLGGLEMTARNGTRSAKKNRKWRLSSLFTELGGCC